MFQVCFVRNLTRKLRKLFLWDSRAIQNKDVSDEYLLNLTKNTKESKDVTINEKDVPMKESAEMRIKIPIEQDVITPVAKQEVQETTVSKEIPKFEDEQDENARRPVVEKGSNEDLRRSQTRAQSTNTL